VGITDGDTLGLLRQDRQQVRIRLAEIDTPESGQPYGNRARQALSDLVFDKDIKMIVQERLMPGIIISVSSMSILSICDFCGFDSTANAAAASPTSIVR
jgi:hypothetical protein